MTTLGDATLGARTARTESGLGFTELAKTNDQNHHVTPGYESRVLVRWGDPIMAGAPSFDPKSVGAASQEKQFGYNCDFVAFMPLPMGSAASDHGLLCVNHEYTITPLMFSDVMEGAVTKAQVETELAAHGHSVV